MGVGYRSCMGNIREVTNCLRALANERRLRIVALLAKESRTVWELGAALGCSEKAASKHLQKLRACGMVNREQHGYHAVYSLIRREQFIRIVLPLLRS